MAHRLTAFEFIAAALGPQQVRLRSGEKILFQAVFVDWIGVDMTPFDLSFEEKAELLLEGSGLGHPFWDGELPTWMPHFDSARETKRIQAIKGAAAGMLRVASLTTA